MCIGCGAEMERDVHLGTWDCLTEGCCVLWRDRDGMWNREAPGDGSGEVPDGVLLVAESREAP